jgi:hypothetical protein
MRSRLELNVPRPGTRRGVATNGCRRNIKLFSDARGAEHLLQLPVNWHMPW